METVSWNDLKKKLVWWTLESRQTSGVAIFQIPLPTIRTGSHVITCNLVELITT